MSIIGEDMQMLGGRQDSGNGTPRNNAPRPQRRDAPAKSQQFEDVPFDDDIPF